MVYGYARVSTKEQNLDRQLIALKAAGAKKIMSDKMSGKNFDRCNYQNLRAKLKEGDLLIIKSIDRLGRNYEEILEEWRELVKIRKIDIKVIDMPLLDTTYAKDILGTFISDLVLQVLSFTAEQERTFIKQRQAEGIAAAKARGVKFGRKKIEVDVTKLVEEYKSGKSIYQLAQEYPNLCYSSIRNKVFSEIKKETKKSMRKKKEVEEPQTPAIKKWGTMNLILVILAILVIIFTTVMIIIFIKVGSVPDTLVTCFFAAVVGECGGMSWIKTVKEKTKEFEMEQCNEHEND